MSSKTQANPTKSWIETPPRSPMIRRLSEQLIYSMPWLDGIAETVQGWVSKFYGQPGQPPYMIKDLLNGKSIGHAVHPAIVALPIGSWTAGLVLDLAWLADNNDGMARASDITMWVGIASALGAAASGVTSWVDTDGPERRTGIWHGLLNGGVTLLNIGSAVLRLTGKRRTAITLASTAYAISLYSAFLGGELSYSFGIGVNHVAWEGGSDDFVAVLNEEDLQPGKLTRVDAAGMPAVLLKDGENIYAIAATCSHLAGPLDEGKCENGIVYCPWHNSGFSMKDGSVINSPAIYAQPTFAVRRRNGKIELRRLEHV